MGTPAYMPRLRLAEVLGSLSVATDMATANPVETGLRATVIATRLAERAGVPADDFPATYYACLTRMLGCTLTAMEAAAVSLGEDRLLNHALLTCDWADTTEVARRLRELMPPDIPGPTRDAAIQQIVENYDSVGEGAAMHCLQAMELTGRLPVPAGVPTLISHMWARWDGAFPAAAGSDIPLPARIIPLARAIELARRAGGRPAAEAVARDRRGSEFDPDLCDLFAAVANELLDGLDGVTAWDVFLDAEPGPEVLVAEEDIPTIAETFADFADQKSGWLVGHSRRVAALASDAATYMGLGEERRRSLYLAGLLHDVGRVAIQNGIWDKLGNLTARERQLVESHSYHTETVLKMSAAFSALAGEAASAHERADGNGYHRGQRAIDPAIAVLGIADVYDALSNERPWRPGYGPDTVVQQIRGMCADGALHAECAAAVLSTARDGEAVEPSYPANLTAREVGVIRLLITGMPTKTIASRLSISPKTADKHIQSVYEKTGARGRAPIALFALKHGLTAL